MSRAEGQKWHSSYRIKLQANLHKHRMITSNLWKANTYTVIMDPVDNTIYLRSRVDSSEWSIDQVVWRDKQLQIPDYTYVKRILPAMKRFGLNTTWVTWTTADCKNWYQPALKTKEDCLMEVTHGITEPLNSIAAPTGGYPPARNSRKAVYWLIPASGITFPLACLTQTDFKAEIGVQQKKTALACIF